MAGRDLRSFALRKMSLRRDIQSGQAGGGGSRSALSCWLHAADGDCPPGPACQGLPSCAQLGRPGRRPGERVVPLCGPTRCNACRKSPVRATIGGTRRGVAPSSDADNLGPAVGNAVTASRPPGPGVRGAISGPSETFGRSSMLPCRRSRVRRARSGPARTHGAAPDDVHRRSHVVSRCAARGTSG